jgi:hypothetical protein
MIIHANVVRNFYITMNVNKPIYYVDDKLLDWIKNDFQLIDSAPWIELYKSKLDNSYWRLDGYDRLQQRFFIRLEKREGWIDFDAQLLIKELLKINRGTTDQKCIWINCIKKAINGLVYCETHAYDMGIRK